MRTIEELKQMFPTLPWIGLTDGKEIQKEVEAYIETHKLFIEVMSAASGHRAYYRYPAYKSKRFFRYLRIRGMDLNEFRTTFEYMNAVKDGLIKNDEWNLDGEILPEEMLKSFGPED